MSTLSIRIPDSYHTMVKEVSKFDNISINQFITAAIGEKLTALQTENYLEKLKSVVADHGYNLID